MGVSSLPKTVTRQRRDCDLNPGPSAPESSTLTTRPITVNRKSPNTDGFVFRNCCYEENIRLELVSIRTVYSSRARDGDASLRQITLTTCSTVAPVDVGGPGDERQREHVEQVGQRQSPDVAVGDRLDTDVACVAPDHHQ